MIIIVIKRKAMKRNKPQEIEVIHNEVAHQLLADVQLVPEEQSVHP